MQEAQAAAAQAVQHKWLDFTNLHKFLKTLPFILLLDINISMYLVNVYAYLYKILIETNLF